MLTTTTTTTTTSSTATTGRRDYPAWAARSERALTAIPVPRLVDLDTDVMSRLRPLAVLLIARPLVAAAVFAVGAVHGWWLLAIVSTWLIYGSALAAVHHLIHGSLGLSARSRRFWLTTLGALVAESGHALQVTHLAHHRRDPDVPDPEGYIENVGWLATPLAALRFRYRLALWGFRYGPRRRRVGIELGIHALAHLASLALLPITVVPWLYLTLIHLASFAFAVLAGKGPQTNFGRPVSSPFVRVRTTLGRVVFFSHDQHLEHHAYPRVPLPRLRRLHSELEPVFGDLEIVDVEMVL